MKFLIRLIIISILILPATSFAQSNKRAEKREKQLEKLKEQRKKEAEKNYEKALRDHYNSQSPETKKMMKETFRKSMRQSENRDRFFLKRWYDNIFNKRKMKENQQNKGINPHQKA
jgi:hypothetical protein